LYDWVYEQAAVGSASLSRKMDTRSWYQIIRINYSSRCSLLNVVILNNVIYIYCSKKISVFI
jgi:hypothetical protein